jgi:protein arginine kinase activator
MLSKIFEVELPHKNDLDDKFFKLVKDLGHLGEQKCTFCGIKLSSVKKIGKMGCYKCYDSFRDSLKPLIKTIHGSVKYKGKMPVSADENIKLQMEIQRLKAKLAEEIVVENFEEAAKIRDTIGLLKTKLDSDKRVQKT